MTFARSGQTSGNSNDTSVTPHLAHVVGQLSDRKSIWAELEFLRRASLILVIILVLAGCASDDAGTTAAERTATATRSSPASKSPSLTPTSRPTPITTTPPPIPALGVEQSTTNGEVTVYAVEFPVEAQHRAAEGIATEGTDFAVADIQACVGAATASYYPSDFLLVTADNRTYSFWNVQIGAREPNLTDSMRDVPAGQCTRGYLTFELPPDAQVAQVRYSPSSGGLPLLWAV